MGEFLAKHITDDGNSFPFILVFETVQELFCREEDKKKNIPLSPLKDEPPVEDPSVKATLDSMAIMARDASPPSKVTGTALAAWALYFASVHPKFGCLIAAVAWSAYVEQVITVLPFFVCA